MDHGHYQEAQFYTELIDKRFPQKKSQFSPQLEMRQLYLSSLMENLEKKEDSIKTSLNQYLKENSKKGISIAGKKHHSYEEVLQSITDMTQNIKQPEDHPSYPQGLMAKLEEEIYKNPPSQKTSESFQILRLLPSHFSEDFDKELCDIASVINHEDQWDLLTTNPQKLGDYIALSVKKIGKDALTLFNKALSDEDSDVRSAAAQALPALPQKIGKDALPFFNQALNHESRYVHKTALEALPTLVQTLGKETTLPLFNQALDDKESDVRKAAAQALPALAPKIGKEDALPLFNQALDDKDSIVRKAAAEALPVFAQTLGKDTIPLVKKNFGDQDRFVRKAASEALPILAQKLGKEDVLPLVKKALNHEDSDVRKAAAKALKIIESKNE